MLKKLLAFMCGIAPVGAMAAAAENIPVTDIPNINSTTVTVTTDEIKAVQSGNTLQVYGADLTDNTALNVAGDMRVFDTPIAQQQGGTLFISDSASNTFSLQVDGDVTVGGQLTVNGNRTFNIANYTDGTTFDATFGSIDNVGTLNVTDVNNFLSGTIETDGMMSVAANNITTGAITVQSGDISLAATNTLDVAQLINTGADVSNVDISGASIQVGNVQNNYADGTMNIVVTGDSLAASGVIENSGALMKIDATNADVTVGGTMKNDAGEMIINAASLKINGGTATNPSFVNNGLLTINVTGETNLAQGFDLNMTDNQYGNSFSLTTGSLVVGGNIASLFANNLNSYEVVVNSSSFATGDVSNGSQNANADMYLAAAGLTVEDVNSIAGVMKLEALGTSDLSATSVTDVAGATTDLVAGGAIDVEQTVTANSDMTLRAQQITAGGIVGNGGDLNISATNSTTGLVQVDGDIVVQDGTVDISGRQINVIGNVLHNAGNLTVDGSDFQNSSLHFGGVSVADGAVYMDGLLGVDISQMTTSGQVSGTGVLSVTGGALNFGLGTHVVSVSGPANNAGYVVDIAGDFIASATDATANGDVNVSAYGPQGFTLNADGAVNIGGDVLATSQGTVARTMVFAADSVSVGGDVRADGALNALIFRGGDVPAPAAANSGLPVTELTVGGDIVASNGGLVEIHSDDINAVGISEDNALISIYGTSSGNGTQLVATTGGVSIQNGITFDESESATKGLVIYDTSDFTLTSQASNADITILGGIDIAPTVRLTLDSARDIDISGVVYADGVLDVFADANAEFANDITTGGALSVDATNITMQDITNNGFVSLDATQDIALGIVKNNPSTGTLPGGLDYELNITAGDAVTATAIESSAGVLTIDADTLQVDNGLDVTGGTTVLDTPGGAMFGGNVNVTGVLNQGTNKTGMLNLVMDDVMLTTSGLTAGGFVADSNTGTYQINGDVTINGDMAVGTDASIATVHINAETFSNSGDDYTFRNYGAFKLVSTDTVTFDNVINSGAGALFVSAENGITMGQVQNSGTLNLDSGDELINMASLEINGGTIQLQGTGLNLGAALNTTGMLYQNYAGALADNDVGISADEYEITASNVTVAGINQVSGAMNIVSSDIDVNGDIDAVDLTFAANPAGNWLDVNVTGNVSGGTKILGLEQMTVGGDYIFDANSQLMAAILPYNVTPGIDTTIRNYWSTISLNEDDTLGKITNAADGAALIQVGGKFTSGTQYDPSFTLNSNQVTLADSQIGITLKDSVDQGTAIWLLHADEGLAEFSLLEKIRNLNVLFCNADGSICTSYLDSLEDGGAYISVRDTDDSGAADSLYVVFDPRFGGPVLIENTKIQPIVARQPEHTTGEYVAAGALDNLIAGQLLNTGFYNKTPIEVIPVIFQGTNVETLMTEVYNRLEHYVETADGSSLVPISRLVQPREIEQIAGAIVMNEHTSFRNFEDRMIDEFIWNRHRSLKKAWADFDFGMFNQDVMDGKRVYGNRFELSGGFDWQSSDTLILGLTGRVSHMSSDNSDSMELGYLPGQSVAGHVAVDVADTNIGLGAYLMKTLGYKFRLYGNAFIDAHVIDTTRNQNFVDTIDGTGTAFALTTEWGLMHDWLNQYVVGNLYARAGYNFGFNVTEKAAGENYMDLESDGYLMLTPGYSLTAQKRIYPSAWFQIRPYATIGVEYDVLGAPDFAKYKFASANVFSEYDIEIDPLWANIGGGFEFVSATGIQVGIDYRYQYNNDMQLHNIKVSGSYRF